MTRWRECYFDGSVRFDLRTTLRETNTEFTMRIWVNTGMQVNYLQVQSDAIIRTQFDLNQKERN
jgi:hypothetical protein